VNDYPEQALVVMTHPDDLEVFCCGTLALWSRLGCNITAILVTSGDKGCNDHSLSRYQIVTMREREQLASSAVLGISHTVFLREPDGELLPTLELRRRITAEIRRYKPDIVVCPDPTRYYFGDHYINHADHRAVAEATLPAATPGANNQWYSPELLEQELEPHQVKAIWLTSPTEPNRFMDISSTIETKITAFMCHASQFTDAEQVRRRILQEAEYLGEGGVVYYREGFRVMHLIQSWASCA
jgi:LmbE family N-acetylglucosaminyl deacetylase